MSIHWTGCRLCGKGRADWQIFCSASCNSQWERGERPSPMLQMRPTIEMPKVDLDALRVAGGQDGGH